MGKCVTEYLKDKCFKKTTNYHHGNLKEELLKQAVDIIQKDGIDSLTLSALSKRLGTSRSAIYRHFSSKNELIQDVLVYGFEMFDEVIAPVFKQEDQDVLKRLYIMGKKYIEFAKEHPNLYRMLFGEKFQIIREENCDIEDEEQAIGFHALVALLVEGEEKNLLKIDDPIFQAQIMHANVHGLASLFIDGHIHIKDNIDGLYETCFKTMTEGVILNK
ncbi:MAG: TetR/AcrR family transcriptional regulator [Arcobacter sp.]|nr:TetR/AcrR family transcriptional regulator [Arcobacter sp.]